ncbi:MAG: RHS repeat-associated core domain-containing protein [Betaproteobacteria bacterium]
MVNAGANQTITLPNFALLIGTASDDALPNPPAALTLGWAKVSGPGNVTFAAPSNLTTTATFGVAGVYVLSLTANDSALSTSAAVTITVNPAGPGNQPPRVDAGANQTIMLPATATLNGSATDDGLPNPPSVLTILWAKVSGPGSVSFGNPAAAATTATFGAAGTYVLHLSASDSALSSGADVTITVNPAGTGNQPPVVSAGPDQTIALPATATLNGTATDDGLPNPPGALTTNWSLVSGPGTGVVFGNSSAPVTTATFQAAGTYVLSLTANDGTLSASSTMQVIAQDGAPLLSAIPDRTILLGTRFQQVLEARDGNINDTLTFALTAAPAGGTLNPAPLIDWMPTAAQLGVNTFTATVTDAAGHTASTTFHVTVVRINQPPLLSLQADATVSIGTTFVRTLNATDSDAGDTMTFALLSGPGGMTLIGANLSWSTTGQAQGDYAATVRVTDSGGLSDTRSFTVTLLPATAPVARDDNYETRLGQTLPINPAGVLTNDSAPYGTLTAQKLTNPDKGTLTAFNADGSFTFQAPPTLPGPVFTPMVKYSTDETAAPSHQPLVIDVDGDGVPEIITHSNTPGAYGLKALHIRGGAIEVLWDRADISVFPETPDCTNFYSSGEPMRMAAGDIDDSGQISIVFAVACKRDIPTVPSFTAARYMAVNARDGTFKWLSPSLGGTRPEPIWGGTSEDGVALLSVPAITRMRPGESPSIVFAGEYANDPWGVDKRCEHIVPGFIGAICRAAFVLDGRDGTVRQTMAALAVDNLIGPTRSTPNAQPAAVVADLDGTGNMNIIFGATVWNADGTVKWNLTDSNATDPNSHIYTYWNGLGNFDDTPDIEIVRLDRRASDSPSGPKRLAVFKADGRLLWSTSLSGDTEVGLPTIADVDGSGRPSVVLIDSQSVCAIDYRGQYKWCHAEGVSPLFAFANNLQTGIRTAVYDLDGDGVPEVIVSLFGERLLFLDGATGNVKFDYDMAAGRPPVQSYPLLRGSAIVGSPIIADFENNGHASILSAWGGAIGRLDIVAAQNNDWRPARKIFNQTSYHVGNINDNGSVPPMFVNNFANPATNVFGTQAQVLAPVDPRLRSQASFDYAASAGGLASNAAKVTIDILPANRPPVFTSTPPTRWSGAHFGGFNYSAHAADPDLGDTITYSIAITSGFSPSCSIGATTGAFSCTGLCGVSFCGGQYGFVIVATDSQGAKAYQSFDVSGSTGTANVPDVVGQLQAAAAATIVGAGFAVGDVTQVFNTAPVGRVLSQSPSAGTSAFLGELIALSVSKGLAPVTMPFVVGLPLTTANNTLASLGLSSVVTAAASATVPANEVMAQLPAYGTQIVPSAASPVQLTASAGSPPVGTIASIVVEPGPTTRLVGDRVSYKATAVFVDGTSADVTLLSLWTSNATGVATVDGTGGALAVSPGTATFAAQVGAKTGQSTLNVVSKIGTDSVSPVAVITSPVDGADAFGPTPIVGTATDANLARFELAYALAGETNWTMIAEGTTSVTNATLGTFDPTLLVNDLYTLRLLVFDRGGNVSEATNTVQVRGDRKVGLFTLGYQDLNVALAGIPITVTRVYDSRDKGLGDFGIGWRQILQTIRIRANRALGTGWVRNTVGPTVSLAPTSPHKVSVTLADGRVEEFDLVVSPTANIGSLDFTSAVGYAARPGTLGKLAAIGNNSLLIVNGGLQDELLDDITLETFDPKFFRYTTFEGTQIDIHRTEGVKKITDANGNAVTFGPNGIAHSGGQSVAFARDGQGRIVSITDPAGNVQAYGYDGNGDLVSHTSAIGGVSRYAYNRQHGLIRVQNALGTQVVRSDYDAAGRLIAVTDADGKQITFTHNPGAQEDIVTDRLGRTTRNVYDMQGNVVSQERQVTVGGTLVNAVTTATYDANGNETSRVNADGLRQATAYNGVLPVMSVTDPTGVNLTTAYAYNARNDVTTATDPAGRAFAFTYDVNGNLTSSSTPLGGVATATMNAQGQPDQTTDAIGTTTVSTRDSAGRVTREETFNAASTLLRKFDYTYDANGNRTSSTLHRTIAGVVTPLTTQFDFDAANRLVAVTDPLGGVARTTYDIVGRVVATTDPIGRRTDRSYDALGRLTRTAYPDGTFETSSYDAEGNAVATTDRGGRVTTHVYDELKRRVRSTRPDGASTQTLYSAGGQILATIDPRGNRVDYTYDTAGRRTARTLPAVANGASPGPLVRPISTTALNALGAPTTVTDFNGKATTLHYNASGRPDTTMFADGTSVQQTFDVIGRRTSIANEEGQATTYAYDGLGRLIAVAGLAGDASYAYDEAGNLITQTDALGRITRFRYDALNRLIGKSYPGGEAESSAYDAVGNLVATTDANGKVTTHLYDAMNRVVTTTLPGGATIFYTYNTSGQRATVTDQRGTTSYVYDSLGRLATLTQPTGEVLNYTRDANGNLLTLATPAATVNYAYDALDRLVQVTAPEGLTTAYYDLVGNRVRQTLGNGIVSDTVYDARNRPTLLTHKSGATTLASYATGFSAAGRRLNIAELDGSVESYAYDAKGRLVGETRAGTNPFADTYTYDSVGNRVLSTHGGVPTAYSYDNNDRLQADGTATYAWDANGNLVRKTQGAVVTNYGYDGGNRLVSILGGGLSNQYAYDADGSRVQQTTASGTTRYLVDSGNNTRLSQVLEERDSGGSLQARYTYGNRVLAMARGGIQAFQLSDPFGSTRALADSGGAITDRYQYDAWGNTAGSAGSTINPHRYRGERFDADSGLYPLRARNYQSSVGRFLSRDPYSGSAEAPVSRHRYQYANGDPVNHSDPTGRNTLAEVTIVEGLNSLLDASGLVTSLGARCSAVTGIDQANTAIVLTQTAVAFLGAAAAISGGINAAYGSSDPGYAGSSDVGYDSGVIQGNGLKRFSFTMKSSGGQFGLNGAVEVYNGPGFEGQVLFIPPPVKVQGLFKVAGEIELKNFQVCHLLSVGKIVAKIEGGLGAGYDDGATAGSKGFGVAQLTASLEASLFAGAFKYAYPLLELKQEGFTSSGILMGAIPLFSYRPGFAP